MEVLFCAPRRMPISQASAQAPRTGQDQGAVAEKVQDAARRVESSAPVPKEPKSSSGFFFVFFLVSYKKNII